MSPKVYWWYIRAMTIPLCLVFLVFFVGYEGMSVFASIWLSNMADDDQMMNDYMTAYKNLYIINSLSASGAPASVIAQYQSNMTAALDDAANIRRYYLWWYLGFGGIMAALVLGFTVTFTFMVASASRYIHMEMLGVASSISLPAAVSIKLN